MRPDRAVRAHRDDRALGDAALRALGFERRRQRAGGERLGVEVDGGLDDDVLVERADIGRELRHHPVGDVAAAAAGDVADRLHLLGQREAGGAVVDVALLVHGGEDEAARAPPTPSRSRSGE